MTTACILLAAGQSKRFGEQDKLLAPLNGAPLICAALRTMKNSKLDRKIAVVASSSVETLALEQGFETVRIAPGRPQSASLSEGMARLADAPTDRVLVMLGDMPFVRPQDIARLLEFSPDQPACAALNGIPMPPALFPRAMFNKLSGLEGDRGAGNLLRDLSPDRWLTLPPEHLIDIDTQSELRAAEQKPIND